MENKKLDELKKERPTLEEQLAFVESLTNQVSSHIEKMKKENPDVVDWIQQGRPPL
jgi:predicted nuclease with TOPRIM domain